MEIRNSSIDAGKAFDWGRTSKEYARYRDIYPGEFYQKIIDRGLCVSGQKVLDLGTGTGVLPRNLYRFSAKWTGTDIRRNRSGRQSGWRRPAIWTLPFWQCLLSRLTFRRGVLMWSLPASASGILTMRA